MDEIDNNSLLNLSVKKEYLKALDAMYELEAEEDWKTPSQIVNISSLNKAEAEEALDELENKGLLRGFRAGAGYQMEIPGIRLAEQRRVGNSINKLDVAINRLKFSQEKSSAAETIFTITLVTFSYVQILASSKTPISDNLASIMTFIAVLWALIIGGGNLFLVTRSEVLRTKDKVEEIINENL